MQRFKRRLMSAIVFATTPVGYHTRNIVLSLLAAQVWRILLQSVETAIRSASFSGKPVARRLPYDSRPPIEETERALAVDGLVVIPGFLPDETFERLRLCYENLMNEVAYTPFRSGGQIRTIDIGQDHPNPDAQYIYNCITQDEYLKETAARVRKKHFTLPPRIILQDLYLPPDAVDRGDANSVPHADRIFPHAKLFFHINEQTDMSGAYIFATGSHRHNSIARLLHEVDLDFRTSLTLLRKRLGLPMPKRLYRLDLEEIRPNLLRRMNHELKTISGPANTAVISDNRGFHARGVMQPGTMRRQIRVQYQYLEMRWYGWLTLHILKKFKPSLYKAFH